MLDQTPNPLQDAMHGIIRKVSNRAILLSNEDIHVLVIPYLPTKCEVLIFVTPLLTIVSQSFCKHCNNTA